MEWRGGEEKEKKEGECRSTTRRGRQWSLSATHSWVSREEREREEEAGPRDGWERLFQWMDGAGYGQTLGFTSRAGEPATGEPTTSERRTTSFGRSHTSLMRLFARPPSLR